MDCIILGIDPGLVKTGWGVVSKSGYDIKYIDCGVIKTDASEYMGARLLHISHQIRSLILQYNPKFAAMERVFVNSNPKTSEKLIMARSAAFIALADFGFSIEEYTPNEIKKNVTGLGHASKETVHTMVQKILHAKIDSDNKTRTMDSMDALAVSICRALSERSAYL